MSNKCVLAIDQGTTNTKALLVDQDGMPVFRTSEQISLVSTPEGWIEQDPEEIWSSVVKVAERATARAGSEGHLIEAIAITNQRETALAWDVASGLSPVAAVSWQCGRGAGICARLAGQAEMVRNRTGLPLAPLISATKWAWLLENVPAVQRLEHEGRLRFGTVDTWLIHKFTRGTVHATDLTNASRTGLLDLYSLQWESELLRMFGIPREALPETHPSAHCFGRCETIPALAGVPVLAGIGDSHAAMFGHARFFPGAVKATYGTGTSLMALTPVLVSDGSMLSRTVAWTLGGKAQYALEGNIPMTGSAIQWVGEFLGFHNPVENIAALAASVCSSEGIYFVPAMTGLGAPYWDAEARGAILGLRRYHKSAHLARAALEAVAFQVADVFFAMEAASGMHLNQLYADGGATRSAALMQMQADLLGREVLRNQNEELSAIGAAWLCGLKMGWWKDPDDLIHLADMRDCFRPSMSVVTRKQLYEGWKDAVSKVRAGQEVRA
jgi:glycerol kinase